ncbi:MAG: two-component sensor histidine kinase/ligand-binding sensor domain-containing protein [Rhodothermales bacterium]
MHPPHSYMLALLLVAHFLATAPAAEPAFIDPGKLISQMVVDHLTVADGLPQNTVNAILQTSDGYLWIGTDQGAVRYNGLEFSPVDAGRTLSSVPVVSLAEDTEGRLWLGTLNGLLTLSGGVATEVDHLPPMSRVEALQAAPGGGMLVGTWDSGLYHCWVSKCKRIDDSQIKTPGRIQAISLVGGTTWVGTDTGVFFVRENRLIRSLAAGDIAVSSMSPLGADRLLVASRSGRVLELDGGGLVQAPDSARAWPTERVWSMMADGRGAMWFGMENQTLLRQIDGGLDSYGPDDGLPGARVLAMYEDREGGVWVGMEGGGLLRFRNGAITTIDERAGLANEYVTTLIELPDNTLAAGTYGGGVHLIDSVTLKASPILRQLPSANITGLLVAGDSELWVATVDRGLYRIDQRGKHQQLNGLPSNAIYALRSGAGNSIWVGTDAGLAEITPSGLQVYTTADGLGSDLIVDIEASQPGITWVATYGGGLTRLNRNGAPVTYTTQDGLGSDLISALYLDEEGTLWIGTLGGGLSYLKDDVISTVSVRDGLFDRTIFQILEDDLGYLWMGSNRGISRVAKREVLNYQPDTSPPITFASFGTDDGLKSLEINGGAQPAGWKSSDGRLWFPTIAGVAVLDPADLHRNAVPPPVVIEQIEADGIPIPFAAELELPAGTRRIEFKFAALSLIDAAAVSYRYRMSGAETAWSSPMAGNTASYTFLEPGDYTFQVVAANNDGVWNEQGALMAFSLKPYFYQTSWFWRTLASTFLLIGAWGLWIRTRQLQHQREQLESMVDSRTRDVMAAKDQIQAQSDALRASLREKDVLLREVHHRVKNNLQMISSLLQLQSRQVDSPETKLLFDECRNRIYSFSMVHERLYRAKDIAHFDFVDYLTGLAEQLVRSAGDDAADIQLTVSVEPGEMDVDRAISCGLIITEFVTNALRHAFHSRSDGTISVEFSRREEMGVLTVQDDGCGIPDLSASVGREGLGLRLVEALVSRLRGEMEATQRPTGGTSCQVLFPMSSEIDTLTTPEG